MTLNAPPLMYNGTPLDMSERAFGLLRRSGDILADGDALRRRFQEDGYLLLPECLDVDLVKEVRTTVFRRLQELGALDPALPAYEGVCHPDPERSFRSVLDYRPDGAHESLTDCAPVRKLVFAGRMMEIMDRLFGEPAVHVNYVWYRTKGPGAGKATPPHYDSPYMSRGSQRICTAWVPHVDISFEMGGLMLMEGSHRDRRLLDTYGKRDVDVYCANGPHAAAIEAGERLWEATGQYSLDAVGTQRELGGRWLGTEYRMGDVLIFGIHMLHATTDNQSGRMRISCDTRYQPASEPLDDRWAGENPIGHGPGAKRGIIC